MLQWVWNAFFFLSIPILFQNPDFQCPNNKICPFSDPNICLNKIISPNYNRVTISSEFGLYCEQRYLKALAQSLPFIGGIFGIHAVSYLSERIGRKSASMIFWGISSVFLLLIPVVNNFIFLCFGFFLIGFGLIGSTTNHFTILSEQTG